MTQLVTRIDDSLLAQVDGLVASGVVESRSDAVRTALEALIERERRAAVGRAIVEGYKRVPQTEAEVAWADAGARAMIAEEPW